MEKSLKSFITKILILTGLWASLSGLALYLFFPDYYFKAFPFVFIIFPAVSVYIHSLLLRTNSQKPEQFNMAFTLSFLLKLFVYATFVGIGIYADKANAKPFTIFILLTYLIFTIFDTKTIIKDIRQTDAPE